MAVFNMAIDDNYIEKNPAVRVMNNLDMKKRMISIDHQLQYKRYHGEKHFSYHIASTKGGEQRYIPMTDRLYKILKA